jgi:integrase
MAGRRARSEGTITKRADGQWEGRVSLGDGTDGRRRRHVVYGHTRSEVFDALRRACNRVAEGEPLADSASKVADYLRWWAEKVLPGTVPETTAYGYRRLIETDIIPHIGSRWLGKLTPAHVHDMLRDLERAGKAPATRRNVHLVLRVALAHAERRGLVTRNVAAHVDTPRGTASKTDDALDLEGMRKLIASAEGDRLEALWVAAVTLGLREGEALALTWEDIDLDAGQLTVRSSLPPGDGLVVNALKIERDARMVALPAMCVAAFLRRKRTQRLERLAAGPRWTEWGYVFTTAIGTPIDPDNLHRAWRKITAKAGLGRLRFHAVRHSAATIALAHGVPLEVILRQLGYAGYASTVDVYTHVGFEAQRGAADAMQSVLEKAGQTDSLER